jgi:1,4-alpha-glucan branching enzyme
MPRKNTRKQPPKKRVYFKLTAPEAREVKLPGSFNNWEPDARHLKKTSNGDWRTFMALEPGVYEYRFLVDGAWMNHSDSELVPNAFGTENCVRVVG